MDYPLKTYRLKFVCHSLSVVRASRQWFSLVANLWTGFRAFDCYAMGADVKECENLRKFLVAATFERSKTYVFDGFTVMNHHPGKTLSICLFKSCSHQEFRPILHSLRFLTVACPCCAVYSGHKLDTTLWFRTPQSIRIQ